MKLLSKFGRGAFALTFVLFSTAFTTGVATADGCADDLASDIPTRAFRALGGSAVMAQVSNLSGAQRDGVIAQQVLAGNVPAFLRDLTPVVFEGTFANGAPVQVTICVMPEYLAVGSDRDFVRVPLGLPAAARIADEFGFYLPTTRMVDAIYAQAQVHLAPSPMKPTNQMSSTPYLVAHNQTVERMRAPFGRTAGLLTAGQKKDLVLSMRLRSAPGRVAIYGWHRTNGRPIQPLSTVHGEYYADYSHGVRLVSQVAFVNGKPRALAEIMENAELSKLISSEGPITNPHTLMASLYR